MTTFRYAIVQPDQVIELAEYHGWTPTKGEANAVAFWAGVWLEDLRLADADDERIIDSIVATSPLMGRVLLAIVLEQTVYGDSYDQVTHGQTGFVAGAVDEVIEKLSAVVAVRDPWFFKNFIGGDID